jgi:hypothetical protein
MRFISSPTTATLLIASLVAGISAVPTAETVQLAAVESELESRQVNHPGKRDTYNDLRDGKCNDGVVFFVKGFTEVNIRV